MQILYLGFDIDAVGGIATYSRYQIKALQALGHRVHVISVDKQAPMVSSGLVAERVPFGNRLQAVLRGLVAVAGTRVRPDCAFVNHVFLAGFALALKWRSGAPFFLNVYNIDILAKLSAMREFAFARADLVISDCRYTIDRMPGYHARIPPTALLYDPVDIDFFRPMPKDEARAQVAQRFGLPAFGDRFVAVTVAAMLNPPNKGHRQTIEALARLKDPRFLYLVVGDGPDRAGIEAHAAAHGVAGQVRLVGRVPQETLPLLYNAADVALLVARGGHGQGEGVPLGMIEAAACGRAVIGGNEDGSVEALDPEVPNGYAIDPSDPGALAERLAALAADPALCRTMGENGKNLVDRVFSFPGFVACQGELLRRYLPARLAEREDVQLSPANLRALPPGTGNPDRARQP